MTLTTYVKVKVIGAGSPKVNNYHRRSRTVFEIYLEKEKTIFLNYFTKYSFYKKKYQTKNEARDKLYKKGHMHILPNFNILVVIVEKLF